ncbi:MAG: sensor histidine kinase, partial [Anaerolineales bacterium]
RLAGELHDKVGQNLTALNIHLNILRMKMPPENSPELLERIGDMQHLVEETMILIRDVMTDLRPPVLDEYGLSVTLGWLAEQFQNRTGIKCDIVCQSLSKRLPRHIENALFRIAQAALDNIARHAEATAVEIALEINGEIELAIKDNGRGFIVDTPSRKLSQPSWGLGIMRERALAIGATLEVFSNPREGTRVTVRIPKEVLDGDPSSIGR